MGFEYPTLDAICGSNKLCIFRPRTAAWDSLEVLGKITPEQIVRPHHDATLEPMLWNDVCSEYDAENLCRFLEPREHTFTPEFRQLEKAWRRDEWNHYIGFRRIFSLLFGMKEEDIEQKLVARPIDFKPILHFLEDEFTTCLLLAYDEIVTTNAYFSDFDLYRSFGHPGLLSWIRAVARDEAYHFQNCLDIIALRYAKRIPEIPNLVRHFLEWDMKEGEYQATFVLDHEGELFTPEFLHRCATKILCYFQVRGLLAREIKL